MCVRVCECVRVFVRRCVRVFARVFVFSCAQMLSSIRAKEEKARIGGAAMRRTKFMLPSRGKIQVLKMCVMFWATGLKHGSAI